MNLPTFSQSIKSAQPYRFLFACLFVLFGFVFRWQNRYKSTTAKCSDKVINFLGLYDRSKKYLIATQNNNTTAAVIGDLSVATGEFKSQIKIDLSICRR